MPLPELPISGLLGPVVALNAWTIAAEVWMYSALIPAINQIGTVDKHTSKAQLDMKLPATVRWKRDNYNHLLEQPTQFYAIALTLAVARGASDEKLDVLLAWGYVGARIAHSLVQSMRNHLMARFGLFVVSSSLLAVMMGRAAMLVF
ncbi:uncharacterized protein N7459_000794 [Penicillium hispanicum]|uniref:uncharacterized protein n=1 Tax=Penicillium hispanicum TaxID=1080232 RepID=UPI0025402A0A|nr:uncharacterized protein N7459_000794 [Penicillium hispanicum]KAJ5594586.1 hypothetical protein N7459_000794 [Penicillium hispanicum]